VNEGPAPLVIAADGAGSAVRHALQERGLLQATEEPLAHDYKELHVPGLPGGGWAFDPHALHVWPRSEYMLIALPNPDRSFTATLFLPQSGTGGFDSLRTAAAARAFFAREFPDALARIPDFDAQFAAHPQGKLATLYCWPWHVQRVLLIGDAAHAIVPFHGQGLNCGFEDCVLLAQLLAGGTDDQAACTRFEHLRRPNTDAIAAMAIENYEDMRAAVLAPDFAVRKQLALDLERRFPARFIPRYSMVMFHAEIPYAEARRLGALQEGVLDALLAAGMGADSALAARLLAESAL
jgi:kynurenine 3-monooxygenase